MEESFTLEPYLTKTRLGSRVDTLGRNVLILCAGVGWFVHLWGVNLQALAAGLAFSVLMGVCFHLGRKRTVAKRENALRRRIGGELALEEALTWPERRQHFEACLWLGQGYPGLEMERMTDHGVICRYEGQRLLTALIPCAPEEKVGCGPLIALQRHLKQEKLDRAVALLTAPAAQSTLRYAAQAQPSIRLVHREELMRLAGACHPAEDAQLAALGQRKRIKADHRAWARHILARHRTRRYVIYGLGLWGMYAWTGLPYYPVPATVLLCLALLTRVYPRGEARL